MNKDLRQPLPSLLRHPFERRIARRLECRHQERELRLRMRVQDILAGRGLTQTKYSVSGYSVRVPQVISVTSGPPMGLTIRALAGQTPDDFAAHAPAIAYNLGVADVRVVPLGPSLIRLDLLEGNQLELVTQQTRTSRLPSLSDQLGELA